MTLSTHPDIACRPDCYLCHPAIPLPWWAFKSRRDKVAHHVQLALVWFDNARASSSSEDTWRCLSTAEQLIREAADITSTPAIADGPQ